MSLTVALLLMLAECAAVDLPYAQFNCTLHASNHQGMYKEGDIIIGGILQQSSSDYAVPYQYEKDHYERWTCFTENLKYLHQYMAFIYAIEEINRNPEILPNLTLGYEIYDSCFSVSKSLQGTVSIFSKTVTPVPNYSCQRRGTLIGIIGSLSSATSHAMTHLTGLYKYPQISYGALDPMFSTKMTFPSFYRTVPDELSQVAGIAQLLKQFRWTWIGVMISNDDSGERALREVKKEISQIGGCIEFSYTLPIDNNEPSLRILYEISTNIAKTKAQVIVLYSIGAAAIPLFLKTVLVAVPHKIWILSVALSFLSDYANFDLSRALHGSLIFLLKKEEIIGFSDFLYDVNPSKFPGDMMLKSVWRQMFECIPPGYVPEHDTFYTIYSVCNGTESLKSIDSVEFDVSNFRYTYRLYAAVYAMAHALHDMLSSGPGSAAPNTDWNAGQEVQPWKLNHFMPKVQFRTAAGDEISFNEKGDMPTKYDIVNLLYGADNKIKGFEVGQFNPSASKGQQLVINENKIIWNPGLTVHSNIPLSVCSESCSKGFQKVPLKDKPLCCFSCAPCGEGEFSNHIDMDNCLKCPDDQWPNDKKDGCINKTIIFLSYSDYLGLMLASIAIAFFLTAALVLRIFLVHRNTPVVKANNQNLCYALLLSLMLAFLCSFLFIGQPAKWTCLIQQAAFGIIFTVAVSCVLAKTITVVIAFNATKPGSRLSRWFGSRVSSTMVLMCTLGEVIICLSWLLTAPPHPDSDTVSETGKVILQCDQGSVTAFYTVIGYMGLLAVASFIVAFLARNLPDRFNEAQLITFSMLVFCSVWVSFIPAYLSTKGRYMVAVEIFAILASSAGLLGCIFIPKCYIILFRPDRNTRDVVKKSMHL